MMQTRLPSWWESAYHTLIHTFAILNYPPHIVPDLIPAKCELRDVIYSFTYPLHILNFPEVHILARYVNS